MQEDGLESSPPLVRFFICLKYSKYEIMYIPLSQDDMSDYIDYINSTLRELNIGEKASPVHQQVHLVL